MQAARIERYVRVLTIQSSTGVRVSYRVHGSKKKKH